MTCALLQWVIVEKQTEDKEKRLLNGSHREDVLKNINNQFGIDLSWPRVKNRLDSLKRLYHIYKVNPEDLRVETSILQFVTLLDTIFGDELNA